MRTFLNTARNNGPDVPTRRFSDVRWFPEIDSTNRFAADAARAGAADGLVVGADHQTAGRGRRGRTWESPAGSGLLVSLVLRPVPPLVTLAAGLAAAEACEQVAGVATTLKWPNDVLLDGRKVGGILSELVGDAAVVGLGLNLTWAPAGAAWLGPDVDRDELLAAYLAGLDQPADVLARYRQRCATIGRRVRVELPGETVEGVAEAVDDEGRLVVDGRKITAGDVLHLR
jgi:BirA family biotin operon repressor/biotin-[acetyl-CoA-carboxylase] ligase